MMSCLYILLISSVYISLFGKVEGTFQGLRISSLRSLSETGALSAFYTASVGSSWSTNINWMNGDPCTNSWYGLTCSGSNLVAMNLANNGLTGTIASEIGSLTLLTNLILNANSLSGSIPSQIGRLSATSNLNLGSNKLIKPIPSEIGQLTSLANDVGLSHNSLTGFIPSEIGKLTGISNTIYLRYNSISGTLPSELGLLTKMAAIYFENNKLSGLIPSQLGQLSGMYWGLLLASNSLTGLIPSELGRLTSLRVWFYLDRNSLSGSIPSELGLLSALTFSFTLTSNQLCGDIPSEVLALSSQASTFSVTGGNSMIGVDCTPTPAPTLLPVPPPTSLPTLQPTPSPTFPPTPPPTSFPTFQPTHVPTLPPSPTPTQLPTPSPSPLPTHSFAPSIVPTPSPSPYPTPKPTAWIDVLENTYWVALGCIGFFVVVLTGWVYFHHSERERIGSHSIIGVSSAVDFVLDVMWADLRLHCTNGSDTCQDEAMFGAISLAFIIIPVIISTIGTIWLICDRKRDLETKQLSSYENITLIFLTFTNPECVILLPWKEEAYLIEDSPFPNKQALLLSMTKGFEDIPQVLLQVTFAISFGSDTVTWVSIATTLVSLFYLAAAKIIEFFFKSELEIPFDSASAWEGKGGWSALCAEADINRFLRNTGIVHARDRRAIKKAMIKDYRLKIGDILEMSNDNLKQIGLEARAHHKNVTLIANFCNQVIEAHGMSAQYHMKPPDRSEYDKQLATLAGRKDMVSRCSDCLYRLSEVLLSFSSVKVTPEAEVSSLELREHQKKNDANEGTSIPLVVSESSSPVSGKLAPRAASFQLKSDLNERLAAVGMDKFIEPLWDLGYRHHAGLSNLLMEDFEGTDVTITPVQLRILRNLAND